MLEEKYIMELVREWARSDYGKKQIKKTCGVEYRDDTPTAELLAYGNQMKQILFKHISPLISSISPDDIIVEQPKIDEHGVYSLKISFNEERLHRDSLYPNGSSDRFGSYANGIEDIVLLFAHGYHADNYVYGTWHNARWKSRKDREPNDFLYDAVDEFNAQNSGFAMATLDEKYR